MAVRARREVRVREVLHHVETTLPDETWAKKIVKTVLHERLAACGQWWQIRSQYWWNGELDSAGEFLVVLKTTSKRSDALRRRLEELHPYEVPYIAVLPVGAVNAAYAAWTAQETSLTRTGSSPRVEKARR